VPLGLFCQRYILWKVLRVCNPGLKVEAAADVVFLLVGLTRLKAEAGLLQVNNNPSLRSDINPMSSSLQF